MGNRYTWRMAHSLVSRKQQTRRWLVLTQLDPMPLFISHVNFDPKNPGPFTAAGSKYYHLDTPTNRTWAESVVAHWAPRGYRFTLTEEVR